MKKPTTDINVQPDHPEGPTQEHVQELSAIIAHRMQYFQRIAMRQLGNAQDAEDAVQDAFLSAYRHLSRFRGQAQMTTWLTAIVINSTRMKARKHLKHPHIPIDRYNQEQEYYSLAETLSDSAPDPEAVFREQELKEKVERLTGCLSPLLRDTIKLRTLGELNTRETASALGIGETAVKARTSRARVHLRRMLQNGYRPQRSPERARLPANK